MHGQLSAALRAYMLRRSRPVISLLHTSYIHSIVLSIVSILSLPASNLHTTLSTKRKPTPTPPFTHPFSHSRAPYNRSSYVHLSDRLDRPPRVASYPNLLQQAR